MIEKILTEIKEILKSRDYVLVAIDGRCGAGKTTIAEAMQKVLSCSIIHIDDFFLRPEQRNRERLNTPGGNVDHERFLTEVLMPLSENREFSYRPYNCKTQALDEEIRVCPSGITVVEGSYSCHPRLWRFYDLHIFADIDPETQLKRIIARNGEGAAKVFKEKWIPLEEAYFEEYSIRERCEIRIGDR